MLKPAIIELVYNTLGNQVNVMQRQNNLTNAEIQTVVERVLDDIKTARLIESADSILKLNQRLEALEKKEAEKENDKPNNQS